MTPAGIKWGRQADSQTSVVVINDTFPFKIAPADANRVALAAAADCPVLADWDSPLVIGPLSGNAVIPLTSLTPGHPACYLDVSHLGSALFGELYAFCGGNATFTLGVTILRQVQELP